MANIPSNTANASAASELFWLCQLSPADYFWYHLLNLIIDSLCPYVRFDGTSSLY